MLNDRQRILELALESLELKKKEIEEEIAEIRKGLRGRPAAKKPAQKAKKIAVAKKKPAKKKPAKKNTRFTKEERLRRSQRMKEYWDNWRKNKANAK
jgi:ribosomal protein L12E/L44/L45/RPP1/RPP2